MTESLGGPKTAAGKAASSRNALIHGIFTAVPVVPGLEQPEQWEAHRIGLATSFNPVGHFEEVLVERIAAVLWRLRRVLRYETQSIALGQESAPDDAATRLSTREAPTTDPLTSDEQVVREVDRLRRERILPAPESLDRVIRYEAHLTRQFFSTLHELEALQARRRGLSTPLARLELSGLSLPHQP
jgi:hypothetical protein